MLEQPGAKVVLNTLLGSGDPSEWEVALSSEDPDDGWSEITGGSYERVTIGNTEDEWSDVSDQEKMNEAAVMFPTATSNWGRIRAIGLYDPSTGERKMRGRVIPPRSVRDGDTPRFAIGTMVIRAR